jgi:hypothetical protein
MVRPAAPTSQAAETNLRSSPSLRRHTTPRMRRLVPVNRRGYGGRHAAGFRISSVSGLSRKLLHALNRIGQFEMATIWGISARSVM